MLNSSFNELTSAVTYAYYTEVKSKGAKIQAAPKDYEYGMRDFVIEDPDCNLIGIGQETKKG